MTEKTCLTLQPFDDALPPMYMEVGMGTRIEVEERDGALTEARFIGIGNTLVLATEEDQRARWRVLDIQYRRMTDEDFEHATARTGFCRTRLLG
jgi:hypothetical protein